MVAPLYEGCWSGTPSEKGEEELLLPETPTCIPDKRQGRNMTDERMTQAILSRLYDAPVDTAVRLNDFIEEIAADMDGTSEDDIRYALKRLEGANAVEMRGEIGKRIELRPRGVEEYEQLTGETFLKTEAEKSLLRALYEHEQENPASPRLSRNSLLSSLNINGDTLDYLVWYLDEKQEVDTLTGTGQLFHQVELTESGRRHYEQL